MRLPATFRTTPFRLTLLFLALFVPARLYGDAGLQAVYVVLGAYGWWHLARGGRDAAGTLPVRRTPGPEAAAVAAATPC